MINFNIENTQNALLWHNVPCARQSNFTFISNICSSTDMVLIALPCHLLQACGHKAQRFLNKMQSIIT